MSLKEMRPNTDVIYSITIGGRAGTGKSTISKILGEVTGLPVFSEGNFMRERANFYGLTVEEMAAKCTKDKSRKTDLEIESLQVEKISTGAIVESRLGAFVFPKDGKLKKFHKSIGVTNIPNVKVFRVKLFCEDEIRLKRLAHREKKNIFDVRDLDAKRFEEDAIRYSAHPYNIDNTMALSNYDFDVDVSNISEHAVTRRILKHLGYFLSK